MKVTFSILFIVLNAILFANYNVKIILPKSQFEPYKVKIEIDKVNQKTNYFYIQSTSNKNFTVSGFKTNINNIVAKDVDGKPIKVKIKSNTTLLLKNSLNLKSIYYEVFPIKKESSDNNFLAAGLIFEPDFHLLNLNALVGFVNNYNTNFEVNLVFENIKNVHTISNYTKTKNGINLNYKNFKQLLNEPIMLNNKVADKIEVDSTTFKISSKINTTKITKTDIENWLKPVINSVKKFTGNFVEKEYRFLVFIDEDKNSKTQSFNFGALHKNNTSLYAIPFVKNRSHTKYLIQRTAMHELLHLFIPKKIHSNNLNNTKHLWFYEGTVEYFSLLLLYRNGMISEQKFWNIWESKIKFTESNATISLADVSENNKELYYQNSIKNFYNKAALVSFFLDVEINAISNRKTNLIDVLLKIENQLNGKAFNDDELIDLINQHANINFTSFYEKYILNRSNLKYNSHFYKIGLALKAKHYRQINSYGNIAISYNKTGKHFFVKQAGNNVFNAKLGDIITAINDVAASKVNNKMFFDIILKPKFNQNTKLTILRDKQVLNLYGKAQLQDQKLEFYRLIPSKKLTDQQKLLKYSVLGKAN